MTDPRRWWDNLSGIKKALGAVILTAVAAFSAGGMVSHALTHQLSLPATVASHSRQLHGLRVRVDSVQEVVVELQEAAKSVDGLAMRVDSLFRLEDETYCLVQALAFNLDPAVVCKETRRHHDDE